MAVSWTVENSAQEKVNAWTHGLGFLASLPAGFALCFCAVEYRASLYYACLVYSLSLSGMYLFSTLSHAVRNPQRRHYARAWDQGTVYLLIAGTFTPFLCAYLTGWQRWSLLLMVWGTAMLGFYSKVIAKHRLNNMTSLTYVLLGWVPALLLMGSVTAICFASMALGGILYTIGTRFLQNDHRRWYFHAIWHLMVIVASACHYSAIMLFPIFELDR